MQRRIDELPLLVNGHDTECIVTSVDVELINDRCAGLVIDRAYLNGKRIDDDPAFRCILDSAAAYVEKHVDPEEDDYAEYLADNENKLRREYA